MRAAAGGHTMSADKTTLQRQESRASMDPRWAAVVARDHQADGAFFYSVKTTGVYCRPSCGSHRAKRIRDQLAGPRKTVTEIIYDAGFNSASRFYETSSQFLGMKPMDYRAGGVDTEMCFAVGQCSLGSVLVAQSAKGVCAILLG